MTGNAEQATDRQQRRRWTVAAVTLAVNLGSFLYLVLIARSASPAIFGALAALAGIALLFEVPANALQVALGRAVAHGPDGRVAPVAAGALLIDACLLGAGVCAVLLALSPLVERFLHLPSITSALLLGAYALPVGISVVPKGVLVGQGRLRLLATGLIAGMVVRIVVGVLLVRRGGGLEGAFVAMVWGEVVTAVIVLIGLREMLRHPEVPVSGLGTTEPPSPAAGARSPEGPACDGNPRRSAHPPCVGSRQIGRRSVHRLLDPYDHRRRTSHGTGSGERSRVGTRRRQRSRR